MKSFQDVGISIDNLLANIGSLVQVVDQDGDLCYVNSFWLTLLGYESEEVEGLNFERNVLAPRDASHYAALMKRVRSGESLFDVELTVLARDGAERYIEGSLTPVHQDGNLYTCVGVFRDITSKQEMQSELDRVFRLSLDMIAVVNFDGMFEKLNPSWERVLGFTEEEIKSTVFYDFVHPDDLERTAAEAQRIMAGEASQRFENRYRCKDGQYRWLSWNAMPLLDQARIYCVVRDITARKQADAMLQQASEQLKAIMHNSGAVIAFKDLQGRYTLINHEFEQILQRPEAEILGHTDADLLPQYVHEPLIAHDREVLSSATAMQFEEVLPGEQGMHTYLSTKFPLIDVDGNIEAIGLILTDITYRKLTEIELLLRNQAIEHSPSGISIADVTLPDQPLIYVNPAFQHHTGYTAEEVIGRNCRFLQGGDHDQPGLDVIRAALREGQGATVVIRNYRKDGSLFYNELSLAPIRDHTGRLTHFVGISMDVSDRVASNEKIRAQNEALVMANRALAVARKQAEDATRLKSQFLATMSHELRTPLNAIIGYTEIQLAGMAGDLSDEQRDYQGRVVANAEHLLDLINDVLDIAKIEAGRMEIVNKPFSLSRWLEEVVVQTQGLALEKDVRFVTSLDERLPDFIMGDPARIKQIAINLLSNAIKFTTEGDVRIQLRKHGRDAWKIIVSDTGIGIPSHLQETIFEEFRQVDSTSKRIQGGTGLGLSIVRKLLLMMGGNVRLQSQVGEGSTFTVILPLVEEARMPAKTLEEKLFDDQ